MRTLIPVIVMMACGGSPAPVPAAPPEPVANTRNPGPDVVEGEAPASAPKAKGNPRMDLIPRSDLFGNPEKMNVRISPDGTQLAWIAPREGVLNIWVAPVGAPDQAKAITADTTRPLFSYWWAYTSKHILYQQDTGGDENFHVYKVDLADGKTTDLTPIAGARADVTALSDKRPTTIVVGLNDRDPKAMDLHTIDVVTGKRAMLVENDAAFSRFVLDDRFDVRFAIQPQPDGSEHILARGKGTTPWVKFDEVPFSDADTTGLMFLAPDGKTGYMRESRGRDTSALVSINLATKKSKVLAEDKRVDVGGVIVHPTKHTIQAVAFNYDRIRWQVLDKTIQKDLTALAKLDGGEVEISSRSLDDKTWVVTTSSDHKAPRFYVWNRAKQAATFLFSAMPAIDKHPLVPMKPVVIKSRDGLDLVSYLTLPTGVAGPVPMVLLVHGGPWGRDGWGLDPYHQLLANRGYAVLSVNFRGSTGFGKAFLNAGNLQWGKTMHDDLIDAVNWAIADKVTPKDKICIMGGSYGGYATLAGLTLTPDVFACGVDIVGPSNLITLLGSIPPYWAPILANLKARVGDPETAEGKAILVAASPLTHAANIRRPLLIGQGANDPRVKQAESEQIVAAMKKHNLPVTYVVFPDEGHGFARPENNLAFTAVMEAFLSAHLGGFYQPVTPAELKATTMLIKDGRSGIPGFSRRPAPGLRARAGRRLCHPNVGAA